MDEHHTLEQIITDASEGYTLVIEYQDQIIGTGNVRHDEIQSVFIHPDYQHQGFGTELISRLEEPARDHSVRTLQLYALTPSKRFFEGLGYHTLRENQFKNENLQHFRYYHMEKVN
jgi:putative acetyltransferase